MMTDAILFTLSFAASSVEMVETLTIVLAVGLTHGWRAALGGLIAGVAVLAAVVAVLGPSLVTYVPLETLQVVIGVLLLTFGLQWLRKAVLRAAGLKAKHDEEQIFEREVMELKAVAEIPGNPGLDGLCCSLQGSVPGRHGSRLPGALLRSSHRSIRH